MKRGNTALKRAVSVTSVAAMAIAGAVLAAPSANASLPSGTSDILRVQPSLDAQWIDASGNPLATSAPDTSKYDGTNHETGPVPVISEGNLQQTANVQIKLPMNSSGKPGWATGDKLTFSLVDAAGAAASDIEWQKLGVHASLGAKPIASADLDTRAGVNASSGHATTAGVAAADQADKTTWLNSTGADVNLDNKVAIDSTQKIMSVTLPDPSHVTTNPAGDAYLLTLSNIRVNVADGFVDTQTATAQSAPVIVTLGGDLGGAATDLGTTTIAYVSPFSLSTDGDASITNGVVTLPTVKIGELYTSSLNETGSTTFQLKVSSDKGDDVTVGLASGASAKHNSAALPGGALTLPSSDAVDVTTDKGTVKKYDTVSISGLTVSGVSAGAKITVTLTDNGAAAPDQRVAVNTPTDATDSTASAFSFVTPQLDSGLTATVDPTAVLPRTAGDNRYDTAAQLSEGYDGNTQAVVIANGETAKQGIDALSANFLAGAADAPILLTQADTLPKETSDALKDLFDDAGGAITVYVMGKTDSVSQAVRNEILSTVKSAANKAATVTIEQIAGNDRYETSVAAASEFTLDITQYDIGAGNLRTAFLASGQVNADALAAGSVSAGAGIPVLLTTDGDELPKSVADAINSLVIQQVVILGGTDRVSAAVEKSLEDQGLNVVRVAGSGSEGRYGTAVELAKLARQANGDGFQWDAAKGVVLANGLGGFPDALAVGPVAGDAHSVVLTVGDGADLPTVTSTYIKTLKGDVNSISAVGGKDRVQDSVIQAALDLVDVK